MFTVAALAAGLSACKSADKGSPDSPRMRTDLVFRAVGDTTDVSGRLVIAPAPHGGIYVGAQTTSGLVEELDSTGRFVRNIGRLGEGPGEYRAPTAILTRGDVLWIWDRNGVRSQFTADGVFLGAVSTSIWEASRTLLLRGDTMIVARPTQPTIGEAPHPLQVVAPDGAVVRAFGGELDASTSSWSARLRSLARDSDSTFWAANFYRYTLEHWTVGGALLRRLTPSRAWFPPDGQQSGNVWEDRPTPMVLGIRADGDGHLLVRLRRARADLKAGMHEGRGMVAVEESMRYIEIVVEVIDATTGKLLKEMVQHDNPILWFLDDGRVAGIETDESGRQIPVVWRLIH